MVLSLQDRVYHHLHWDQIQQSLHTGFTVFAESMPDNLLGPYPVYKFPGVLGTIVWLVLLLNQHSRYARWCCEIIFLKPNEKAGKFSSSFQRYISWLSGVPDFFDRNKILSGYDLSHYQVPHCIRVFFYFVWFVFIHHNFQFYFELCTYCNILDIYLSQNLNFVNYLLF